MTVVVLVLAGWVLASFLFAGLMWFWTSRNRGVR